MSTMACGRLRGDARNSRKTVVDELKHDDVAAVQGGIEGLGLDTGVIQGRPCQIVSLELGIRNRLRLLGDGLNSRRTIDWFLRASDICQP